MRRLGLVVWWERFGILNKERPSKLDLLPEPERFFPTKTFQSFKSNRVRHRPEISLLPDMLPDYHSRPSTMTSSSSLTGFMSDSSFLLWASQGTTPQTFPPNLKFVKSFSLTGEFQSPGGFWLCAGRSGAPQTRTSSSTVTSSHLATFQSTTLTGNNTANFICLFSLYFYYLDIWLKIAVTLLSIKAVFSRADQQMSGFRALRKAGLVVLVIEPGNVNLEKSKWNLFLLSGNFWMRSKVW